MGAVSVDLYAHTNINIRTNTGGTATEWAFGDDGSLTAPGKILVQSTATSTSTTTGALQVAGGVGVGGNLYVGGLIRGLGNSKLDFTTYGANSAYLTTTGDDSTALFMGTASAELYAQTNILIRTNTDGTAKVWTFGDDGSLTFPDNTIQTTAWTPSNVLQDVTFSGNVTFNSSSTYILSTNTVYTDNIIELHYTSTWAVNDGKDIGLRFHYYDTQDRNAFFGRDNTTGYLEWLVNSSADNINNVTGTDGTFRLGSIILRDTTVSNSTSTGALTVAGGVGVNGGLYVGGTVTATNFILNGYQVSTSTGGITSPYAGIFTSTNTSSAVSTTTGALQVAGGVGIGGGVYVGGAVTATIFVGVANSGTTSTTAASLGYIGTPINTQASTYTLVASDAGKTIYAGGNLTIPANSSVAFPIGTIVNVIASAGITVAITTDTLQWGGQATSQTGTRTVATYGMASLIKVTNTIWYISGVGVT
jgi:hypothetical protein